MFCFDSVFSLFDFSPKSAFVLIQVHSVCIFFFVLFCLFFYYYFCAIPSMSTELFVCVFNNKTLIWLFSSVFWYVLRICLVYTWNSVDVIIILTFWHFIRHLPFLSFFFFFDLVLFCSMAKYVKWLNFKFRYIWICHRYIIYSNSWFVS